MKKITSLMLTLILGLAVVGSSLAFSAPYQDTNKAKQETTTPKKKSTSKKRHHRKHHKKHHKKKASKKKETKSTNPSS